MTQENTAQNNNDMDQDMPQDGMEEQPVETSEQPAQEPSVEAQLDDMRDKMMRAMAEAENTRKRAERMQAETSKYAVSGFAKDMLDIADNLRRALDAIPEDQRDGEAISNLLTGVEATEKVMLSTFEKHGITKIAPTEGRFDPNFHEVMFEADMPDKPAGEIIQLLEAGYKIHDRLLRPARVGVAKNNGSSAPTHQIDKEV